MQVKPSDSSGRVSVVIVNYYTEEHVLRAVTSLSNQLNVTEIIIVDNGSSTGLLRTLRDESENIYLIEPGGNLGFARGSNMGAEKARSEFLFFLNPDATVDPECINRLIEGYRKRPGIVGPTIHAAANDTHNLGATMNHFGMSKSLNGLKSPLYVSGCALFTSRTVFEEIGRFDSRYFLFVEDAELCWRALLAGYDVHVVASANVHHEGGVSAEGGYFNAGKRYHTTTLRIALRERNTITMMIASAPWYWIPIVLPALIVRAWLMAISGILLGRFDLALSIIQGLLWNIMQLPNTLERRRSLVRKIEGEHESSRRFVHRPILLIMLLQSGVPRISGTSDSDGI